MSNETSQEPPWNEHQEQWNRVHAQLLKSVADAQGKLLAGINEVSDKLDKLSEYSTHNLEVAERRINERLDGMARILVDLATPRRQLERPKRIVKRAVERKR